MNRLGLKNYNFAIWQPDLFIIKLICEKARKNLIEWINIMMGKNIMNLHLTKVIFTWKYHFENTKSNFLCNEINPFASTGDAYMRQLFHCLQWYAGSERVKELAKDEQNSKWKTKLKISKLLVPREKLNI